MAKPPKRTHLVEAIEFLKKGPLTAMQLPHISGMKHVIYTLRVKGWPIATEVHPYFDQFGVAHDRAEYRLVGNWTEMSLPFGGVQRATKPRRKAHRAADKGRTREDQPQGQDAPDPASDPASLLPQSGRPDDGGVHEEAPGS